MEHLHLPPFFVVRGDGVVVAGDVAANQMQDAGAAVLVFKDLADQVDCTRRPLEPALHSALLWKLQLVYARNKTSGVDSELKSYVNSVKFQVEIYLNFVSDERKNTSDDGYFKIIYFSYKVIMCN